MTDLDDYFTKAGYDEGRKLPNLHLVATVDIDVLKIQPETP